jgi:DNA-binding transcriptional LysR family regulator
LDGKQIAAFVAVADELHLGRAASRLGMPRTTLSARLRALEARLGFDLVDRSHRCRIALTTAGEAMLAPAREQAAATAAVEEAAAQVVRGERGVVRVALLSTPTEQTDHLLAQLRHVNEHWAVEVRPMSVEAAQRAMAVGGLELAISWGYARFRTGPGALDPRPNRLEGARRISVPNPGRARVTAWWRASWPQDDLRFIHGRQERRDAWIRQRLAERRAAARQRVADREASCDIDVRTVRGSHDANVFLEIVRDMRSDALDACHPERVEVRRARAARRRAARHEDALFRDERARLGEAAAAANQRARDRPRILERMRAALTSGSVSVPLLASWIVAFGPDAELPTPDSAADP